MMAEQLLMELKSKRPKMWMMITNGEGEGLETAQFYMRLKTLQYYSIG